MATIYRKMSRGRPDSVLGEKKELGCRTQLSKAISAVEALLSALNTPLQDRGQFF